MATSSASEIYGSYRYNDGSEYIGEWDSKGQRHGVGQLTSQDGSVYVGQFQHGLCSGLGVLVFSDGARYILNKFLLKFKLFRW